MAMELLEKGRVRFWTQVEKCTSACKVEYAFNDVIITQGKVGIATSCCRPVSLFWFVFQKTDLFLHFCFQKYTMNFDQSTGIIEMFMDSLEVTDEGTFTFDLVDGKAKGTTSLVLIGDGETSNLYSHVDVVHTDLSLY